MDVVVRKYNENDYESVDKLLFDSFGYKKEKTRHDSVYEFVACLDDEVVGYFNLFEEVDVVRDFKIYHIGYVCVDPSFRGKGIGHTMMDYAISYAKDHNVKRMELTSGKHREAAHKLYESMGFEKRDTSVFRREL